MHPGTPKQSRNKRVVPVILPTTPTTDTASSFSNEDTVSERSLRWSSGCEERSLARGGAYSDSFVYRQRSSGSESGSESGNNEAKRTDVLSRIDTVILHQEDNLASIREQARAACNRAMMVSSSEQQSSRDTQVFYSTMKRVLALEQSIEELATLRKRVINDCNTVLTNYERSIRRIVSPHD